MPSDYNLEDQMTQGPYEQPQEMMSPYAGQVGEIFFNHSFQCEDKEERKQIALFNDALTTILFRT